MSQEEINNSEILFLYEAKLCNPNGDPDEENRPRMDPKTNTNLVTDVRLKRYFRDYIIEKFGEDYIWVSTVEKKHVDATKRLDAIGKKISLGDKITPNNVVKLLNQFIDMRLFGATIPIKAGGDSKGAAISFTGPVQFSWGYSLHPVELVDSSTITSIFAGRIEEYGTMGKDWRVYYSLIAFYGIVSGTRAHYTKLRVKDVKILDDLLWKSLITMATTRSKIGQRPLLYLRVEYKDKETYIGDLRDYVTVEYGDKIRDLDDLKLSYSELIKVLEGYKNRISKIYIREENIPWKENKSLTDALKEVFKNVEEIKELEIEEEDLKISS